jgi:hypothetical protein
MNKWTMLVKEVFEEGKKKYKNFSFKQALQTAKERYSKIKKNVSRKIYGKGTKKGGNSLQKNQESESNNGGNSLQKNQESESNNGGNSLQQNQESESNKGGNSLQQNQEPESNGGNSLQNNQEPEFNGGKSNKPANKKKCSVKNKKTKKAKRNTK